MPKSKTVKEDAVSQVNDKTGQDIQDKFEAARTEMASAMIEREEEIDLVLTALIAQENPLLVGPPGTGKSMLMDNLMRWMGGATPYSILMNKFTQPEEVFGPVDITGLKASVYRRITTAKLPEAEIAFLDEVFKASSAILNTMLRILNERVYENGDGKFNRTPLLIALAASNEWPDGNELGALFDRFLFRKKVKPIRTKEGRQRLLFGAADHTPKFSTTISAQEVLQAHETAKKLPWSDLAMKTMMDIIAELNKEGIFPGDRRIYKSRMAVRAYAYLNGAPQVRCQHLEVLAHTLWDDPTEQPEKTGKIVMKFANPTGFAINEKLLVAEDVVGKCTPTDAVPKLQAIQRELEAMDPNDQRVFKARNIVAGMVKEQYNRVIGLES
jgi:MoxR-like ATPase